MLAKDSSGVIRIGDAVIQEGRRSNARVSGSGGNWGSGFAAYIYRAIKKLGKGGKGGTTPDRGNL